MRTVRKRNLPVNEIRRFLEPGPIVLVSSAYQGESNIMTMGWHMVMGFEPSLIGCYIWDQNHSFEMIRKSRDTKQVTKYSLFILEVVKAHVAVRPKYPQTIHYRGDGVFMISGENTGKFRKLFKKRNL
jgi:flavin reductase (DIM6/NTAB) family NADH-FMN oxidoreductase RutF